MLPEFLFVLLSQSRFSFQISDELCRAQKICERTRNRCCYFFIMPYYLCKQSPRANTTIPFVITSEEHKKSWSCFYCSVKQKAFWVPLKFVSQKEKHFMLHVSVTLKALCMNYAFTLHS